jgi:general secretion pathway protein H
MTSPCEPESAGPRHGREAGFTLLELIVTLSILGLALALIVGYKPPWSSGLGLRGTAAELASGLRLTRSEAILRNQSTAFEIDLAGHRYRVGSGAVRQLLTVTGEQHYAAQGAIRFNPDGSSTGGRIEVADGARSIAVGVDWLSGRVSVAEGQ